jgi:hypothetical protein
MMPILRHSPAVRLRAWSLGACCLLAACAPKGSAPETLFERVDPGRTGIHFSNEITENDTLNILRFEYVYNGGGAGIADLNGDSLPDLYFTGNQKPNRLYLNRGDFRFEDVTAAAGVEGAGRWSSGVAIADVNGDGRLDLYISATVHKPGANRANLLYINQGNDAQGIPRFAEEAARWGVADTGHSVHAAFLDYDRDGDLDLYVLTNEMEPEKRPNQYHPKRVGRENPNTDRFYRNNGDGSFSDLSREAGITVEGYGLGINVTDINQDGWPDIYVSNDYLSNDLLWINQQDGSFRNEIAQYFPHQCYSAMGNDLADLNNDGQQDLVALDMLPASNERKKQMLAANNYTHYINNDFYGYQHQYVRNVLQLSQGWSPEGRPLFGDLGQMAGVHQTDWSWTPMLMDFDQDGFRDLIITNGFPRDITDHDFGFYNASAARLMKTDRELMEMIPEVKIHNYAFRNLGGGRFEDRSLAWGLGEPSFSNGAAYGDLDLDGDLDFVVNNIDDSAFVYRNQLTEKQLPDRNFLRVALIGEGQNTQALGTRMRLYYGGQVQYYEHTPFRGYISSVEPVAHFGLGAAARLDSLRVLWPDGRSTLLREVAANQTLRLRQADAPERGRERLFAPQPAPASLARADAGLRYRHEEKDFVEFDVQRTLPHKYSQRGPGLAVGDLDGDGREDLLVGGSAGMAPAAFLQGPGGRFAQRSLPGLSLPKEGEDMGLLLFDADGDGDSDLYAVSGSYERPEGHTMYQDRFYRNEGGGSFRLDTAAIPHERASGSCVRAADYDRDGDLDLFVGGRVRPGAYPLPAASFLLRNEGGRFVNVSAEAYAPLDTLGMISDALWTDFDNDGWADLLLAGEWMPLTFLKNLGGRFENITASSGIGAYVGWWNSLAAGDFDQDGDMDYVAGNLGLNTRYCASEKFPLYVTGKDFDRNGSVDAILGCYGPNAAGDTLLYPVHQREDLLKQVVLFKKRYNSFAEYGAASYFEMLTEAERLGARVLRATWMESSYIENLGGGKFALRPLPREAQAAPLYAMLPADLDGDGHLDLLAVGNDYGTEVFTGRYDALKGLALKGDGRGSFVAMPPQASGFLVPGDAKALSSLRRADGSLLYVCSQNRDSLRVFAQAPPPGGRWVPAEALDAWAEIKDAAGRLRRIELPYGHSYLSQGGRFFWVPAGTSEVRIASYSGKIRIL